VRHIHRIWQLQHIKRSSGTSSEVVTSAKHTLKHTLKHCFGGICHLSASYLPPARRVKALAGGSNIPFVCWLRASCLPVAFPVHPTPATPQQHPRICILEDE